MNSIDRRGDRESPRAARVEEVYGGECPGCSARLSRRIIRLDRSFQCPSCGWNVCVPRYYSWLQFVLSLLLASGIAYALGTTRVAWLVTVAVCFFPTAMVVSAITHRIIPPRLRLSDDYQSQMHSTTRSDDK
jgi:hypothetical protein